MFNDVFYVYMLTNKWHTVLYTGSTNSIEQRHFEHKNKVKATFTKKYNCDQLVIATQNPEWDDLSPLLRGGSFTSFRTEDR